MGVILSVLVVVGAAAVVLPRVLRRPGAPGGDTVDAAAPPMSRDKVTTLPKPDDTPSRRFAAVAQRVGGGAGVPPEPLRNPKGSPGWQPETVDSSFHQTTAYPEPPARYEAAEEGNRSGARPAASPATGAGSAS